MTVKIGEFRGVRFVLGSVFVAKTSDDFYDVLARNEDRDVVWLRTFDNEKKAKDLQAQFNA